MPTRALSLFLLVICSPLHLHLAASAETAPAAQPAECRLALEGYGDRPGLKSANLSCTGGNITAAADPLLLDALGRSENPMGVLWSPTQTACEGQQQGEGCMLSICGGAATFIKPTVTSIVASGLKVGSSLCISGAQVTLVNGTFTHGVSMRAVRISGSNTSVQVSGCTFAANTISQVQGNGAALAVVDGAQAIIWSSTFAGNAAQTGGAIFAGSGANVIVQQGCPHGIGCAASPPSQFRDNSAVVAGGDVALLQAKVYIAHAEFHNGTATTFGGAFFGASNSSITLVNTTVVNATSISFGGGLHAEGAAVTLNNATFSNNKAGNSGGALALSGQSSLHLVSVSHLVHNSAARCGGGLALASTVTSTGIANSSAARLLEATNNTASFAADICVSANNITVVSTSNNLDSFISSLDSEGGLLHVTLNVSGPQGLPADDPVQFTVFNSQGKTISTQGLDGKPDDGLRQAAIKLRQPPGTYRLQFTVDGVSPAILQLRVVPCPVGYVTVSTGDACSQCVSGYFSFSPSDKACTMCVANAQCPGGSELHAVAGFWKSAPMSDQVHRCINPSACLGGSAGANTSSFSTSDYKTAQCAQPYQGNLCGDCKDGYGKPRPFSCRKCMPKAAIVILFLTAVLVMIGLIKLLMFFQSADSAARPSLDQPIPRELMKVLVLHGQWLFIMANMVGIPWPATLVYPMQVVVGIWSTSNGSSLGLDCILPRDSAIPLAIQKVLLCLLTPVAIICVVVAVEAVIHRIKPRSSSHAGHHFASLIMTVVFLFLPVWVGTALSLFTCIQLDRPADRPYEAAAVGTWWVEDISQECYSPYGYHRGWALGLGIPLIVLLCLVLPGGVFLFMWYSRKQGWLNEPAFERHYGFMYSLWRTGVCWYEAVVVVQTTGLVMVATFGFALGPYYQALVTSAVLGVVVVLLAWVRPFKCRAANTVAVQSACVLLLTSYTALTFLPCSGLQPGDVYGNIMGVVLVLLNVFFLGFTAWKLVRLMDWSAMRAGVSRVFGRYVSGVTQPGEMEGTTDNSKDVDEGAPAPSRAGAGEA